MEADLYTTVVNTSGAPRVFSFLPPHGVTLAADEERQFLGDLVSSLQARGGGNRRLKAFEAALTAGDIAIRSSPRTYLFDAETGNTKVLDLDNSVLGVNDPSWGALSSE